MPVPPKGFDPISANSDELATYGYPERPVTSEQVDSEKDADAKLQSWERSVSVPRATPSVLCETKARAYVSNNWAGYANKAGSSTAFIGAEGDFTLPARYASCTNSSLADWVGVGGFDGSTKLYQAGTAYLQNATTPVAWYEYLNSTGGISLTTTSLAVHAGDAIHAYVVMATSSGQTTFYVADNTTGQASSVVKTISAASYYDGSTVEWVDERLTYSGSLTPLATFTSVGWHDAWSEHSDASFHSIAAGTDHEIGMYNGSTKLAQPDGGRTSSTSFTDNYHACS
ncbi:G1 family glutamic endopeptidase [Galbitalea sp. SE-J8]|uniref:G1 family glutamic endopeptidase n=1 Tax=Galbitalea sp. SE-J8 TaxID=3054952 RepID=UPI00259CC3D2|nr:G1 family glutamic endopeptidase [Galbitalea sp. SE-J8]MDM4761754.1 G1 family glutamic endopeptidase [Galbitalea sp. SE-J8]